MKAASSVTLVSGRSACLGGWNGVPSSLLQVTHRCMIFLTNCLPFVIQNRLRSSANVSLTPPWLTCLWHSSTISLDMWLSLGSRIGNLVSRLSRALASRPLHRRMFSLSVYTPSCFVRLARGSIVLWVSRIHAFRAFLISSADKLLGSVSSLGFRPVLSMQMNFNTRAVTLNSLAQLLYSSQSMTSESPAFRCGSTVPLVWFS